MGVVYLVEDNRQSGKLMALKTLHAVNDLQAVADFRSEFRNLRGVVHPHLPEMYDFGLTMIDNSPVHYFTCEFVEGKPLDQLCKSWRSPEHLRTILVALSRALAFLHSRSLLHCDLKRENVLASVGEDGSLHSLKLVDFGLAARITDINTTAASALITESSQAVGGTIDYLAPELLEGQKPTVQTDLYALGMMMYRLATGRLPFEHDDPLALIKTRTTNEAPAPFRFRADLPVGLSDVISALIRLRAEDRPQSARHAIALLNERDGTDFAYETAETRTAYLRSATSVTNTTARERLTTLHSKLETATPQPLIIMGTPGLGRTRLLRDFASELQLEGYTVRLVESDADLDATDPVRVMILSDAELVTREWLYRVLEVAMSAGVWCIIGLNESDPRLEAELGTYETIYLSPMTREETAEMVQATFPGNDFPAEFANELYDWGMGFPSALQTMFDQMLDNGLLRIGLNGWELMPGSRKYELSESVSSYLDRCLYPVHPFSRCLMNGLACSDIGIPSSGLESLQSMFNGVTENITAVFAELKHVGWISEQSGWISLSTKAMTNYIRNCLSADDRATWHERLRTMWTSLDLEDHPARTRALLYYDIHAGTWQTSLSSAEQTLSQAINDGEHIWARNLVTYALSKGAPAQARPMLLELKSQIAFMASDMDESARALGELLHDGQVELTLENLDSFARYAMLLERLGNAAHAEEILQRCRTTLPAGTSRWASSVFGTLAWIVFKRGESDTAAALAEEGLVRVPPQTADAGFALLLNTVATQSFYRGEMDAAALAWQRCLEINESIRDRKGIANMYNNLGVLAAQSGERLRARNLWHKCAEIARDINDVHRLAGIYNNLGIDALETGGLADAEDYYLKSLSLFRKMHSPREQVATLSNLGELAYHRADFTRAQAYWQEAVQLADSTGDHESQIEPLIYWGKLLCYLDQSEQAQSTLHRALTIAMDTGAKKGAAQAHEGLAELHIRTGHGNEAQIALREANRLLTEDVDPLALLHLHLTECAIASERNDTDGVKQSLEKARKVGDIKWDPFTSARTLVYGLLFAGETLDTRERSRVIRQLTPYPDFLWKYYWATARQLAQAGTAKKALEEYGRAVSVLKGLTSRMTDEHRDGFLASSMVKQFKEEATALRKLISA